MTTTIPRRIARIAAPNGYGWVNYRIVEAKLQIEAVSTFDFKNSLIQNLVFFFVISLHSKEDSCACHTIAS